MITVDCAPSCLPRLCLSYLGWAGRPLSNGKNVLYKDIMLDLFKTLVANRNLLKNLVIRDLKHRYVGSIGGFLWSVIHPLVLLASYTFIFGIVWPVQLGPEG